jgi:hypothetical protein
VGFVKQLYPRGQQAPPGKEAQMRLALPIPRLAEITVTEAEILADLMYPKPSPRPVDPRKTEVTR